MNRKKSYGAEYSGNRKGQASIILSASTIIPSVAKGAVAFLVIYITVAQNIFGIDALLRQNSQFLASRFLSFFYPQKTQSPLIVLFDDDYLQHALGGDDTISKTANWPAPFVHHASVLRVILEHKPAAVFYDIIFRPRPDNDKVNVFRYYLDQTDAAEDETVPIIMGYLPDGPLNQEVYEKMGNDRFAAVGWDNFGDFMPHYSIYDPRLDDQQSSESLHTIYYENYLTKPKGATPPLLPTVAFRLYEELLKKEADDEKREKLLKQYKEEFNNTLFVYWAAHVKEPWAAHTKKLPSFLQDFTRGCLRTYLALVHIFDPKMLFNRESHRYGKYVDQYTSIQAIGVRQLINLDPDDLGELINNRVILIGTNISGLPDMVSSPIEGILPGVYLHAMAYDNLVQSESNYKTDGEAGEVFGFGWADLLETVVLVVMVFSYWLFSTFIENRFWPRDSTIHGSETQQSQFGYAPKIAAKRFLFYLFLALISFVILGLLLYHTWENKHWDCGNFLGMLSISIPLYYMLQSFAELLLSLLYAPFRNISAFFSQ